jgi:transcriptional regulator with XRE-family HTH domain
MNIGKNISVIRRSRGLTQSELAKIIKKDRSIVTRYENGSVEISAVMAFNVAKALKVPISRLFH